MQGKHTPTTVPERRPLRSCLQTPRLESRLLHHRSRGRTHHHLHLRRGLLPLLLQEQAQEEHGQPRPRPLRPLPRPAPQSKRPQHPRLHTDAALAQLPRHEGRPILRRRERSVTHAIRLSDNANLRLQVATAANPRAERNTQSATGRFRAPHAADISTAARARERACGCRAG